MLKRTYERWREEKHTSSEYSSRGLCFAQARVLALAMSLNRRDSCMLPGENRQKRNREAVDGRQQTKQLLPAASHAGRPTGSTSSQLSACSNVIHHERIVRRE